MEAEIGHYSKSVEKQRGVYPPLGLAYIASSVLQHGHEARIIDCDGETDYWKAIEEACTGFKPDLVGFYTMTWTFRQAKKIFEFIKELIPGVISVVGGPNVTAFPVESLEIGGFDYAVQCEGEYAIKDLLDCIQGDKAIEQVRNLIYRADGAIRINSVMDYVDDLDEIPFPAWNLLPVLAYNDIFTINRHFATMIASRGCPFKCTFCDRKNRMGSKWRIRSVENVLKEIEFLKSNYGIREIMFFDDNFIISRKWILEFCDRVRELNIKWECRTRVDTVNGEILRKMKESGCYRIRYGMESGNDEILKILKKDITVEKIRECAKNTNKVGIEIFAYFMMGLPHESLQNVEETVNLALEIDPDFVLFSKTILIPGSEIFDWAVQNRIISKEYWISYMKGEALNPAPSISTAALPEATVDRLVSTANKKIYRRPQYLLKRLLKIKSFHQFRKQVEMGKTLLMH